MNPPLPPEITALLPAFDRLKSMISPQIVAQIKERLTLFTTATTAVRPSRGAPSLSPLVKRAGLPPVPLTARYFTLVDEL